MSTNLARPVAAKVLAIGVRFPIRAADPNRIVARPAAGPVAYRLAVRERAEGGAACYVLRSLAGRPEARIFAVVCAGHSPDSLADELAEGIRDDLLKLTTQHLIEAERERA